MKKKIFILSLMLFSFFLFNAKAEASIVESRIVFDNELNTNFNIIEGNETSVNCNGIFTSEALDLISDVLGWFRILGPITLVVMMAIDFGGAVLQQDNDALKKASSKVIKRAIATVALFFVPTFIRILINLPGVRSTIQIPDDPLCGTMVSVVNEDDLLIK